MVGVRIKEEPERAAFAFFAWRFSFSGLLAAVFESMRASKPGHPMIRVTAVCATHAPELRRQGLQLVEP